MQIFGNIHKFTLLLIVWKEVNATFLQDPLVQPPALLPKEFFAIKRQFVAVPRLISSQCLTHQEGGGEDAPG